MLSSVCTLKIESLLGTEDSKQCDFSSIPSTIVQLFRNCTFPRISISSRGKVDVPESFTVRNGGSSRIYGLLGDPNVLVQFPVLWIKAFLDTISIILSKGVVNVIRFQCVDEEQGQETPLPPGPVRRLSTSSAAAAKTLTTSPPTRKHTLIRTLLDLLRTCDDKWKLSGAGVSAGTSTSTASSAGGSAMDVRDGHAPEGLPVLKRVIHLIGLAATAGLTTLDVKDLMSLLQRPSALTLPLLQALKRMLGFSTVAVKASPMSFFNLGGRGSGIATPPMAFPFTEGEYQFFTWFRVEEFSEDGGPGGLNLQNAQHVISVVNAYGGSGGKGKGIDIFIWNKVLHVNIDYGGEPQHVVLNNVTLRRGVWFHLAVKHTRAVRISMFSKTKDDFTVHLDHQCVYQDAVKYPDASYHGLQDVQFHIGQNLDGQITPVYFFSAVQSEAIVETMARLDAGKSTSFAPGSAFRKMISAYFPDRCVYQHALDIYGGNHAKLGPNTYAWSMTLARDVFGSIGGVSCLLPMLPRLVFDNYDPDNTFTTHAALTSGGSPGGAKSSAAEAGKLVKGSAVSMDDKELYGILETESLNVLFNELEESKGDTCVSLIIQILANALSNHRLYQFEMAQISGIEMVEYALGCAPPSVLREQGEPTVSALKMLRAALAGSAHLDAHVIRHLFLNIKLWARASFEMQRGLLRVVLAYIKSEPNLFGSLVDVYELLQYTLHYYSNADSGEAQESRGGVDTEESLGDGDGDGEEEEEEDAAASHATVADGEAEYPPAVTTSSSSEHNEFATQESSSSTAAEAEPGAAGAASSTPSGHLDMAQKQTLRWCVQSAIISVIQQRSNPQQHVQAVTDFLATCKNVQLLNEIANMVLVLIVEGGATIVSCLIEACHGAEEFASFILRSLVHQPCEELRCTGIRIITHFYLRIDLISRGMSKLTLKKKKTGNIVSRAMDRAMQQLRETLETDVVLGLERLRACGGIALLSEIVSSHRASSTVRTYNVLLEMLLSKPNQASHVEVVYSTLFDDESGASAGGGDSSSVMRRVSEFAAQFMSPDQLKDDVESDINVVVLPAFLEVLPKLTLGDARQQVYSELLSLLKHSEHNRVAFCSAMSWHICMHDLLAQLTGEGATYIVTANSERVGNHLDMWAEFESFVLDSSEVSKRNSIINSPLNFLRAARSKDATAHVYSSLSFQNFGGEMEARDKDFPPESGVGMEPPLDSPASSGRRSRATSVAGTSMSSQAGGSSSSSGVHAVAKESEADKDICFAIGMKVYSTLLVHAVEGKTGWREVSRTISQSLDSRLTADFLVMQSVLSQLVNELTFVMQWKYKDLQAVFMTASSAKPTPTEKSERDSTLDYMNNIFSVVVTVGQYVLHENSCMTGGIPDWKVAKLRLECLKEVVAQIMEERAADADSQHHDHVDTEYLHELAENLLQERITEYRQKVQDSKDSAAGKAKGQSFGLDSPMVVLVESDELLANPYLPHASDFLSLTSHRWTDLGKHADLDSVGTGESDAAKGTARKISSESLVMFNDAESRFNVSTFLHPLERGQTVDAGKLVLILQNLRLFDAFFWPNDQDPLRNAPMLRFNKDKELDGSESPGGAGGSEDDFPRMTLCSAVMCQCLFVLNTLTPLNDLASLNVNRLHVLIEAIDDVDSKFTPTDDLVLATVVHVTFCLQRVSRSLDNLYRILGLDTAATISNTGLVDSKEEEVENHRLQLDEIAFNKICADMSLMKHLEEYFDNSAGRRVLAFIMSNILLLVTALEKKEAHIAEQGLDERTFTLLESLMERVAFDLDYARKKNEDALIKRDGRESQSPVGRAKAKYKSTDTYGDIFQMKKKDTFDGDAEDEERLKAQGKKTARSKGHVLRGLKKTGARRKNGRPSMAQSQRMAPGAAAIVEETVVDGSLKGPLIIKVLRWLRDSYFTCNMNKCVGVAKVLSKLERFEADCNKGYLADMAQLNETILAQRDFGSNSIAEMSNLNNLSGHVSKLLAKRGHSRQHFHASVETHKLKAVADSWNDSIRTFSEDWSPWYQPNPNMRVSYQLSRHKDACLRHMLFVRSKHSISHDNAAYSEGKHRDQLMFEAEKAASERGGQGGEAAAANATAVAMRDAENRDGETPFSNILKGLQTAVGDGNPNSPDERGKTVGWGDGDDDDDDAEGGEYSTFKERKKKLEKLAATTNRGSGKHMSVSAEEGVYGSGGMGVHAELARSTMNAGDTSQDALNPILSLISKISRPPWTEKFHWSPTERPLLLTSATQITIDKNVAGTILLTNEYLYFHPVKLVGGLAMQSKSPDTLLMSHHDHRWSLKKLNDFYGRRHLLQTCAMELFFADDYEVFFVLESFAELQKVYRMLRYQHTPLFTFPATLNPRVLMRDSPYTEMWKRRQISNFEYLMRLNTLAGRSYSDITQYPVFPWVLADYTSASLDLSGNTPGVFRDLSKPVGALNPTRLAEIMERFNSFDSDTPPHMRFMYGSHYSSAGVVVFFLLRQEPFTSLAVNMQGGRFDCPDRLFFDVGEAWRCALESVSDVKELIPEMYCCPEMFLNSNKLPLGKLQDRGRPVDDVVLPPWANGDPFEFVRIMRQALESDYVSEHLHEWIDLIFGYKQTGVEAINACNQFYYLTYEGAVDINAIADPVMRDAAKAQVTFYGQTPSQLFKEPHEKRLSRSECMNPLCADPEHVDKIMAFTPQAQFGRSAKRSAVVGGCCSSDRLLVLHADLTVCTYSWSSFPDGEGVPFESRPTKRMVLPCAYMSISEEVLQRQNSNSAGGEDTGERVKERYEDSSTKMICLGCRKRGHFLKDCPLNLSGQFDGGNRNSFSGGSKTTYLQSAGKALSGFFSFKSSSSSAAAAASPSLGDLSGSHTLEVTVPTPHRVDHALPPLPPASAGNGARVTSATPGALEEAVDEAIRRRRMSLTAGESPNATVTAPLRRASLSGAAPEGLLAAAPTSPLKDAPDSIPPPSSALLAGADRAHKVLQICHQNVSVTLDSAGAGKIFSTGFWDNTMKVVDSESLKVISESSGGHIGPVTCLHCGDKSGKSVVSGGRDGTLRLWVDSSCVSSFVHESWSAEMMKENESGAAAAAQSMTCVRTLWGHTSPITCISHSAEMGLIVSGSSDGLVCIHTVRNGNFVRAIRHMVGTSVDLVLLSSAGYLLAYSRATRKLGLFWLNGEHIATVTTDDEIEVMAVNGAGTSLICGTTKGVAEMRVLSTLEVICEYDLRTHGTVTSIWVAQDQQFLFLGSADGTFTVLTDPEERWRLLHAAISKAPILGAL